MFESLGNMVTISCGVIITKIFKIRNTEADCDLALGRPCFSIIYIIYIYILYAHIWREICKEEVCVRGI